MLFDEPTSDPNREIINEVLDVMVQLAKDGDDNDGRLARDGFCAQSRASRDIYGQG